MTKISSYLWGVDLLLGFLILVGFAIASTLWGVDSRPGFSDGRVDRVERWFPHSRTD